MSVNGNGKQNPHCPECGWNPSDDADDLEICANCGGLLEYD